MKPPKPLRRALAVILLMVLAAGTWWAWQQASRPWGQQAVSFVPAAHTCGQQGPLRYCVYSNTTGTSGDVVYHLHGRNLGAEVWNDPTYYTALLQAFWQRAGLLPPTVVSLSYGPVWLLAPPNRAAHSGLLDTIWQDIRALEARLGTPRRRMLLGESMGGLNSLVLGLSHPQQCGARAAGDAPDAFRGRGLVPLGRPPPAHRARMGTGRQHGGQPRLRVGRRVRVGGRQRPRVAACRRQRPRLPGCRAGPGQARRAAWDDRYGVYEGAERLARRAAERGLPTEWRPLYGGHCAVDIASLGLFLVQ